MASQSWEDLLQKNRQLTRDVENDTQFPPIQRNLDQLEALSRQLKARTSRLDASAETTAATRLLAREGINADQLAQDLKKFELKATFEDVFPVEAASLEEYLQQMHDMSMISAIQEAQKDNVSTFEDFMFQHNQIDWDRRKRGLLQSLSRLPVRTAGPQPPLGASTPTGAAPMAHHHHHQHHPNGSSTNRGFPTSSGLMTMQQHHHVGTGAAAGLLAVSEESEKKSQLYLDVVARMNRAREQRHDFKTATAFKEAFESGIGEASGLRTVGMLKIWRLVQAVLGEVRPRVVPSVSVSPKMAMVMGSRWHLEEVYEKFMEDTIASNRTQAALGGSPGNLQRVHAFLRVRLRDHGLLDFDSRDNPRQPPLDTTWHQIYTCLRAGYYEEAKQVAERSRTSRSTFAPALAEWIATGGQVSTATALALSEECDRLARSSSSSSNSSSTALMTSSGSGGERQGKPPAYDRKKMLLLTVVSGSKAQAERLLRDTPPLFSTIEDFLWFRLAMLRDPSSSSSSSSSTPDGLPAAAFATIPDLQAYLSKYEASYYTKDGRDPLVYPYIQLLSLQFHGAIVHLFEDPSVASSFKPDAIHIAIAFAEKGALAESAVAEKGSGGGGGITTSTSGGILGRMNPTTHVASLIRDYGTSYAKAGDLGAALEYFAAAAEAMGGGYLSLTAGAQGTEETQQKQQQRMWMLEHSLRELLHTPGGIVLLLGRTGLAEDASASLPRFFTTPDATRDLVLAAANDCHRCGLYDEAVELYKRVGSYAQALDIINRRLSEAIASVASRRLGSDGEMKAASMVAAGNDVLDSFRLSGASTSGHEEVTNHMVAFKQLETILTFFRLAYGDKPREAIRELHNLPFLPLDSRSSYKLMEGLDDTSRVVENRVPDILIAAMNCLDVIKDTDGSVRALKIKIANFVASATGRNWPHEVFERAAQMHGTF